MTWKPIDFQGIIALDSPLIDLLRQYLDEKEEIIANAILKSIPEPYFKLSSSEMPPKRLSDAIDAFVKQNFLPASSSKPQASLQEWDDAISKINAALWHYVETLEGCAAELFLQLEQTTIEQWHPRLLQVVTTLKEILVNKIENTVWGIKRLEHQLKQCRQSCEKTSWHFLKKLSWLWTPVLDKNLNANLMKTQEFLRNQYQKFAKRYKSYLKLQDQVDQSLQKFGKFEVLTSLDTEFQLQFKKLYELLKLNELNNTEKTLPARELIIALRNALSVDKATALFKEYYESLHRHLFDQSLEFKKKPNELTADTPERQKLQAVISSCQAEIHMLGATIANYRGFLLSADPDPYVRTRLGFSEWVVGPEPAQTKPLLNLGYDVEALDELADTLSQALKKGPEHTRTEISDVHPEIEQGLHEMGQPLASYRLMRSLAERILDKLQQLDELGSFDPHVVEYVGKLFSHLLRADWHYNALHGIPLFHQLYATHQGLLKPIEDRQHVNRMAKFKKLLNQIHEWVKQQKTHIHFHDIELDINDIKGYLQDFFGYVQRISCDPRLSSDRRKELHQELSQELLEYRYLFGNFFYQLRQHEIEGQLIRKQCLFVDQYFESIESKLVDLESGQAPKDPLDQPVDEEKEQQED